jgi:SP family general alpha glucoside:H+ symporter-like MFS transporter
MASKESADGAPPLAHATVDGKERQHAQEKDQAQTARLEVKNRVIQGAKAATEKEQSMSLLEGIRLYPKSLAWSALISTCIVMEGYDVCLINNFCIPPYHPVRTYFTICQGSRAELTQWPQDAFPQFNRKYGQRLSGDDWEVPAPWQAGLSNVRPCHLIHFGLEMGWQATRNQTN